MKIRLLIALFILSLGIVVAANAQITNLMVNGASSNFTMAAGDMVTWEMNVPNGTSVTGEIWYDINNNGAIDPATDIIYVSFTQTDGDTSGNGGPGDMDGLTNGHLYLSAKVGVAPGKYVFRFTQNLSVAMVAGTVSPLVTVSHSISGHVTPPSGQSAQWILVEISPRNDPSRTGKSWDAYTDASGNYTIQMDADTSGNPWEVQIGTGKSNNSNPFPGYLVSPSRYTLTISAASYTGNDFSFVTPAAKVSGYLKDENGNPLVHANIYLYNSSQNNYNANTDNNGYFEFGLAPGDLNLNEWHMGEGYGSEMQTTTHVMPNVNLGVINSGDNLSRNLHAYVNNSTISGVMTIDGAAPGIAYQIFAGTDSTISYTMCNPSTGAFSIPVTNKMSTYWINVNNLPITIHNYISIDASPGQTGVNLAFTTTGVREVPSPLPASFSLAQSYPNPFNPSTTIRFSLPYRSVVTLVVYDVLGRIVATPANRQQLEMGVKEVQFDGSGVPSGIYFYRLTAVSISDPAKQFSQTRKMLLVR